MNSDYNTQTCVRNITDIVGTERYCKENVTHTNVPMPFEVEMKSQVNNVTVWKTQLDKNVCNVYQMRPGGGELTKP